MSLSLSGGQVINWLSPIRLGDIWRIWRITCNKTNSLLWSACSIVAEKSADSLVLAMFALVLALWPSIISTHTILLRLISTAAAGALFVVAVLALRPSRWPTQSLKRFARFLPLLANKQLTDLSPAIRQQIKHPKRWAEIFLYSSSVWTIALLTNVALDRALNVGLPFAGHLVLVLALQLGLIFSVIPANVGLFPLAVSGVFALFNIPVNTAIVYGTLLYVVVYTVNLGLWIASWVVVNRFEMSEGVQADADNTDESLSRPLSKNVWLAGLRLDAITLPELTSRLHHAIHQGQRVRAMHVNAHAINLAQANSAFQHALNQAEIVFCDGHGVRLAAQLVGHSLPERMTPPDWILDFAQQTQAELSRNPRWYLLGAQDGIAQRAASAIQQVAPNIQFFTHPGFFDADSADNLSVIQAINDKTPDVLLVGMGMPRQEVWLHDNWPRLKVPVAITVGALFNYLAHDVPRGPRWLTDHGFEWLCRLIIEPRRLWKRYVIGNVLFAWNVAKWLFEGQSK
jgi:N-acetylglucosaminyldiphosphoundecaprenol N-acetyl-beta-D-mannosaminyltransferase